MARANHCTAWLSEESALEPWLGLGEVLKADRCHLLDEGDNSDQHLAQELGTGDSLSVEWAETA